MEKFHFIVGVRVEGKGLNGIEIVDPTEYPSRQLSDVVYNSLLKEGKKAVVIMQQNSIACEPGDPTLWVIHCERCRKRITYMEAEQPVKVGPKYLVESVAIHWCPECIKTGKKHYFKKDKSVINYK